MYVVLSCTMVSKTPLCPLPGAQKRDSKTTPSDRAGFERLLNRFNTVAVAEDLLSIRLGCNSSTLVHHFDHPPHVD